MQTHVGSRPHSLHVATLSMPVLVLQHIVREVFGFTGLAVPANSRKRFGSMPFGCLYNWAEVLCWLSGWNEPRQSGLSSTGFPALNAAPLV